MTLKYFFLLLSKKGCIPKISFLGCMEIPYVGGLVGGPTHYLGLPNLDVTLSWAVPKTSLCKDIEEKSFTPSTPNTWSRGVNPSTPIIRSRGVDPPTPIIKSRGVNPLSAGEGGQGECLKKCSKFNFKLKC